MNKKNDNLSLKSGFTSAQKDLFILALILIFVFVISYFFNVFVFLVIYFQKHPHAVTYIDEIISCLLALSIGFAVFSWRRLRELKKESAERLRLQEELIRAAETKANRQLIISSI